MANHGYVFTKKTIDEADFIKKMNQINFEQFGGLLDLEFDEENGCWITSDLLPGFDGQSCWLSDHIDYTVEDFDWENPVILSKKSVIEFRHGGGSEVKQWLENVFLDHTAK